MDAIYLGLLAVLYCATLGLVFAIKRMDKQSVDKRSMDKS